jgi:DNA-directed RNA polymerase subunit L/DNA-directed RNA polymerase alpha subunit
MHWFAHCLFPAFLAGCFFAGKPHKVEFYLFMRERDKMASDLLFTDYVEGGPALMTGSTNKIQASFRVSPIHVTVANTLRRQILAAIPTVGFKTEPPEASDVFIEANTTPLVNEMLMHRIGMIPIAVTDPTKFEVDEYEFRLAVENVGKTPVNVTASDFVVVKRSVDEAKEEILPTKNFFPVDPITKENALITVLRPQYNMDSPTEKLVIRAKASVGTGRQNMRYSSVAQCSYEYTTDKNPKRQTDMFQRWMATSKKVPDPAAVAPERLQELRREFETLEIQRCYLQNEKGEPYDFIFHIESVGILSVPTIIERGLKACEDIVSPYTTLDVELTPNITMAKAARRMEGFELVFQNEEHTLGNLLQTFLVERHVEGEEQPRLSYAAYKVPHPLRQEMVLVVSAVDGEEASVRKAVANVCIYLKQYFNEAMMKWQGTPKGLPEEQVQEQALPQELPPVQEQPVAAKTKRAAATKKK